MLENIGSARCKLQEAEHELDELKNKIYNATRAVEQAKKEYNASWEIIPNVAEVLGGDNPVILKKEEKKLHLDFPCICAFSPSKMKKIIEILKKKFNVDEVVAYHRMHPGARIVELTEEEFVRLNKENVGSNWGTNCDEFYSIASIGLTWVLR